MREKTSQSLIYRTRLLIVLSLVIIGLCSCGGGGGGGGESSTIASSGGSSAPATGWAKAYGGVNRDIAHSIQQTADGGFIFAGETYSFGAGNADEWVVKLDADGTIQWQRAYGEVGYDMAHSIQQTSDGGYIVAGESSSFGGGTQVWILKLEANGGITWQNLYGGSGDDVAYAIQQTSDDGYIVAGETTSFGAVGVDALVFKLKSDGTIDWWNSYGGANDDRARSIQKTSDGGFIVAGETSSFGAGDLDVWVLKLDASGTVQWEKRYGGANDEAAYSVQQTSDGGYIIAGGATPVGAFFNDVFLLKLDADGNGVWQNTYGGANDDVAYSVQQTSDGGYIVAGRTSSFGNIFGDIWIIKVKSTGSIDWQKTYGGNDSNSANAIRQTSDGRYVVAGETAYFGVGSADVCVGKLDSTGEFANASALVHTSTATAATAAFTVGTSLAAVTPATTVAPDPTFISPLDSWATTTTP
jgi:uncharacterized delta-60 repeat protein